MVRTAPATFNLLREPWIPCATARGKPVEVGLLEMFSGARDFRDISDPSPLVRVALYRLLLAILYRTHEVRNSDQWRAIWERGWDTSRILEYLGKWEAQFDLFSPSTPFYQRADLDLGNRTTPLTKFSHEFAAGNNKQLFDHSCDDNPPRMSPARAARLLVACQAWCIGGGKSGGGRPYFTSAALPKGASLVAIGGNLHDTLILNLVRRNALEKNPRHLSRAGADDRPAWERTAEPWVDQRFPDGPADYFTWQSRYIRLLPEVDGAICNAYFVQGVELQTGDATLVDPFQAYTTDEKLGHLPRGLSPDRAAWRDSESLFGLAAAAGNGATALALHELRENSEVPRVPAVAPVLAAGIAVPGGQPPPDLWCAELFRVPTRLFDGEGEGVRVLTSGLELAKECGRVLRRAVETYAGKFLERQAGAADKDAVAKLTNSLCREADYWAALEAPFHQFLPTVVDAEPGLAAWRAAIRNAVISAFESSLASQDATGRHLRARNAASANFYGRTKGINALIPNP